LLRQEADLDGYIVTADAALKAEFEGPARAATDASLAAATAAFVGEMRQTVP
jgi:methyl-accepting chemotaxis protein